MSTQNLTIQQTHNIGITQGVHYGDNVTYDGNTSLIPKHVALEKHKELKTNWEIHNTCDWIVQEDTFQSWQKMESKSSFLWLHGGPGCGKSTLMSRIIESIYHTQFPSKGPDAIHLLYYYVGFGTDQKVENPFDYILKTFWEQASKKPHESSINSLGKHFNTKAVANELHKLLDSSGRDIYIVFDALDQLPLHTQVLLITWLDSVAKSFRDGTSDCRFSAVISSRDCDGIDRLRDYQLYTIEVTAERNKHDIRTYLEKNLESRLLQENPGLRKDVIDKLTETAEAMFLWVILQTFDICDMELELEVREALERLVLPHKLDDLYRTYADGFEALENTTRQQIVQRVAGLLAHNTGSMSKDAILVALSLEANGEVNKTLYSGLIKDPAIIIRYSKHLVQLNESLGIFQFCHITTFHFFKTYQPATYNRRIAQLCLSHLCSPEFSQGPQSDATWYNSGSLGLILQKNPFLLFASVRWAISIKKSFELNNTSGAEIAHPKPENQPGPEITHSKILDLLKILFGKNSAVEARNLQLAFQIYKFNLGNPLPGGVYHEHIICYFGLVELFDIFMKKRWLDLERLDHDGLRPIHWAIRNMDYDEAARTVEKLIAYKADINAKDKKDQTPLYYASSYGNLQVTRLLIGSKAELNLTNMHGETALISACRKHHHDVVLLLLQATANVKIQSSFGTALQVISLSGCDSCAEAILHCYGDSKIIENDGPFGTSLHAAAFYGHIKIVKLLCSKRRINLHATHKTYGSPVTAAATGFNPGLDDPAPFLEIIQLLLQRGVKVNDRSGKVGPALRAAAYHGSVDIVRLLLDNGAEVRKAKGPMGTAYEAAKDRGHTEIMAILLEKDSKAKDYGKNRTPKWHDRQQIQRQIFRATVKVGSMETINNLITQFEKFFESEIRKGESAFLKALSKLGEDAFQDVIRLATKSRDNSGTPMGRPENIRKSRFSDRFSSLLCFLSEDKDGESIPDADTTGSTTPQLRRAATTFVQDSLGEHFPQVLDRMTQAAVKILELAIKSENKGVIKLIADTWVEALNNLVSYPGFGESMLQMVVQRRANELKEHLTNQLEPEEGYGKARALALVGIELILTAVERGVKFKHLSFVLSKLWIKAVNDVEDLGEKGQAPVQELICIYAERFSDAIMRQDQVNAEICGQGGIELLRAAALSPKKMLLEKLSSRLVAELRPAEENMWQMVKNMITRRWEEYGNYNKDKEHEKALGLVLASMEMLRAALNQGNGLLASTLCPLIESGFQSTRTQINRDASAKTTIQVEDLESMFYVTINLFVVAEDIRPGYLNSLAAKMLSFLEVASGKGREEFIGIVNQRIGTASRIVDPAEREKRLLQIARTVIFFIDVAVDDKERYRIVLSALKGLAVGSLTKSLPGLSQMRGLARYGRAIEYLDLESQQS